MATTLQTLPPLARSYSRAQRATIDAAMREVTGRWLLMGTGFDAAWSAVGPTVIATLLEAQRESVQRAEAYIPAVLEETGQTESVQAFTKPETLGLVGYAGSGVTVAETVSYAPIRAKQAVARGATASEALTSAGSWLALQSLTILADTSRSAESLGMFTRPVSGYVRMVNGGACGRCVVQAGKWFRTNSGFLRHPRCKCVHIPASENLSGDWRTEPKAYFDSLDDAQQIKLMGSKANAQAVIDGADIGQITNAYGKTAGMRFAQESPISKVRNRDGTIDKFTSAGTTRRAQAAQQQRALRRNGPIQQRLMPQTIARVAKDEDDRMRLLRLYGWVLDDQAVAKGRAAFQEMRRAERATRARRRRADRAA